MSSGQETLATRVGRWLLAFVVPASALAIGSLIPWVLVVVAGLAAVACTLLWVEPATRSSKATRWALLAVTLLVGATALQAIPLPAGLVAAIAPTNADVWARAFAPFGEGGLRFHPITVAPAATHVELLRGLLYASVFLGALRIALTNGGSTFLERLVIVSACLVAFSTLGHPVTQADKVFGIYRPREGFGYVAGRIGPLLNPNHVAAYLNLGACVAAGSMFGHRRSLPRPLAIGVVVLLAGTSVWAGSRGGMGSLVFATILIAGMAVQQRRNQTLIGRVEIGVIVLAVLAAAVLLGIGSSEMARSELAGRDLTKLDIIASALRLVPQTWHFGVGRGAFETMYPIVRTDTAYFTYLAPENLPAQWLIEWGVPVAVAGFVLFGLALRPKVVLAAARPAIGAWAGVVVVALHDLVDFHLEVPGVVVLLLVCVALVVSSRATGGGQEHSPRSLRAPRWLAFGTAAATVIVIALVVPNTEHSLREERDHLSKVSVDLNVSPEEFRQTLHDAIERYPAEPYFPLMGAVHAQRTPGESVLPWIGKALERYPHFGRAHLVLARYLARGHRAQARLEYRLAYTYDAYLHGTIAKEAPFLVDDTASAFELVPESPYGITMLESVATALGPRLPSTAIRVDDELLRRQSDAKGPLKRRVRAAMSDLANEHPWCADRVACATAAIADAEALIKADPRVCEPRVMLAELRILSGEQTRGLDELMEAVEEIPGPTCVRELLRLSIAHSDKAHADRALDRALRSGCGTQSECLALYQWAASAEEQRGNLAAAIAFWKRVSEQAPDKDAPLLKIADLATRIGLVGEGIEAYQRLARAHPNDPQWPAKAAALRARALPRSAASPR